MWGKILNEIECTPLHSLKTLLAQGRAIKQTTQVHGSRRNLGVKQRLPSCSCATYGLLVGWLAILSYYVNLGSPTPKIQPKSQVSLYTHTISHHLTPIQQLYKPFGADGSRVKLFPPETSTLFFRGAKSHGMAGWIKYRKFTTHLTVM